MRKVILLTLRCSSCGRLEEVGVGDQPQSRSCRVCSQSLTATDGAFVGIKTIDDRRRKAR